MTVKETNFPVAHIAKPGETAGLNEGHVGTRKYEADGAIAVGSTVMIDAASTGKLVVAGTTGEDHRFVGIYQGSGGTGTTSTTANLVGEAAVDGDVIDVAVEGVAYALVEGTTDVADTDCLKFHTTAGYLMKVADPADGIKPLAVALAAQAADSAVATQVLLPY